jgi:glycerophosphoryl diester phosphodiesterase
VIITPVAMVSGAVPVRAAGLPAGTTVKDEMADFLYRLGVDALFTDNPDQFPRR